jgi:hypothetical protein
MEAKPISSNFLAEVLTASARWVADVLSAYGFDSKQYAFAVLIWPVGQTDRVSSIAGSFDPGTQAELSAACAAASEKAKNAPTHTTVHTTGPAGHA